ncbi:MAG: helix-turn-helix transcriptional regulator [Coleofasciculaceae cyanobacterium SM2_3_26]|nr:helix-turn-helix transcriptional regulator [Coleofasciculaceae cyanobacterium SM2_3_26]
MVDAHSDIQPPGNDSQSGLSPKDLNLVREYIANHKSHPITIGELAALVCLSEYHFIRSFKKSAGMTPYRYILHKRLELARDLILDTKMRLVDIAIACGFSSQSHMTRLFKRHFHQTPMEARRGLGA